MIEKREKRNNVFTFFVIESGVTWCHYTAIEGHV